MSDKIHRATYDLSGIVQGVGFRPALARLAAKAGLGGWIQNRTTCVRLVLEGERGEVVHFINTLRDQLPRNARLDHIVPIDCEECVSSLYGGTFEIVESHIKADSQVQIPADLSICADCAREILDVDDRRYGYPFTTCTACGPRYTVVNSMPYDRQRTTLDEFPLCDCCRREYEDPDNRRFHAESIACPVCGPRLWLETANGERIEHSVLRHARRALSDGLILAVRGIGGYLLAVDPFNADAVVRLRGRKKRPDKPFALMARNLDVLGKYVELGTESAALLSSPIAPIVIADAIAGTDLPYPLLNADNGTLGVMLPNSPLHMLLFQPLADDPVAAFDLLVMTSGNRGGEPICIDNSAARERLAGIADLILCHDREINLRNDDSIYAIRNSSPQIWRRARGCAPDVIRLSSKLKRSVLALGAGLKNTIAVAEGSGVVISPHIGDLDTPEALDALEKVVRDLPAFLQVDFEVVAVDMHPDLRSTIVGRRIARERGIEVVEVQHHHAHAAACLAEHGRDEGLAFIMDGTGFGADGNIWGAELLRVGGGSFDRIGTFAPAPLPGGDAATTRPARQLAARLLHHGIEISDQLRSELDIGEEELQVWSMQIEGGLNCPWTSAAGRLFDSFSALLGLVQGRTTYDAQAPIRLEAAARSCRSGNLPDISFHFCECGGVAAIDWQPMFELAGDIQDLRERREEYALAFHRAIAEAGVALIESALESQSDTSVALSGGVFMNGIISDMMARRLTALGIEPLLQRRVPPNDGGISFGQAVQVGLNL